MKKLPIPAFVHDLVPSFVSDFAKEHVPECVIDAAAEAIPVAAVAATVLYPHSSRGAVSIGSGYLSETTRNSTSANLESSGITYAGGDLYYVVEDTNANVIPVTLSINRANGSLSKDGISFGTPVKCNGGNDMEGCAYDPYSGTVWISQETSALIREFDPVTGELLRSAPVPAVQKKYNGNYSLESLSMSGDGLVLWTANEESLTVDGDKSSQTVGSTVRLTKFVRQSVRDNWSNAGEWAYVTQPVGTARSEDHERSGVADLCALPDGSLLVLERRCYENGWVPDFQIELYLVDFSGATDVSSLSGLKDASYKAVSKKRLWYFHSGSGLTNYEGICLGPRLDDGSSVLVLISDGGTSGAKEIMTLKLSGLDIRELYVEDAEGGASEPAGGPYRFVGGRDVTVSQVGATGPYADSVRNHWAWYADSEREGVGTAVFQPAASDVLHWYVATDLALPLLAADSFERVPLETEAPSLAGWSGDGFVAAETPPAPSPAGYPLGDETHEQVLLVDGQAGRDYADAGASGGSATLDAMVRVTRERADAPVADVDGAQTALFFAIDGRATLQHRSPDGSARLRSPLSDRAFADGEWVRTTFRFDYATDPSAAWCQVKIDGEPCLSASGVRSPSDRVSPGSWYRVLSVPSSRKISGLTLVGFGAVDDVALYDDKAVSLAEFAGRATTNGVPFSYLAEQGLPWDTSLDFDDDGQDTRLEWAAGTDPWDEESGFRVIGVGFDANGRFQIRYTGSADAAKLSGGRIGVVAVDDLADAADDAAWKAPEGKVSSAAGVNTWTQLSTSSAVNAAARFFKVVVSAPED